MSGRGPGTPESAAARWPPIARFIQAEAALGVCAEARGRLAAGIYEFLRFGVKQGWACLFGALLLVLLVATHVAYPAQARLARYDVLFLAAIVIQALMLAGRLETREEAVVILAFQWSGR